MLLANKLKNWRENYYTSKMLAAMARPVYRACSQLAFQLPRKIKKNGVAVSLPRGRILRIARDSGINLASLLFWGGPDSYEPQTSRTLRFFFERVSTFVDVGANYGFYSLLAAHWNPGLRVISFEPVPEVFAGLRKNLALNHLSERVEAHRLALASRSGTGHFYMPVAQGRDYETTGTLAVNSWQQRHRSPTFEVETVRFDDFERQHPMQLDLVKLDVEDFEADVLVGMQGTIRRDRPFIVCEILPREHRNERTRELVESFGYTPYLDHSFGIYPGVAIRLRTGIVTRLPAVAGRGGSGGADRSRATVGIKGGATGRRASFGFGRLIVQNGASLPYKISTAQPPVCPAGRQH